MDRFRSSAATAAATSGNAPAITASDQNSSEGDHSSSAAVVETAKVIVSVSGAGSHDQDGGESVDGGTTTVTWADMEPGSTGGTPAQGNGQSRDKAGDVDRPAVTTPPRSFLKPGIFTMKANVDTSHHGGDSATPGEAEVEGGAVDGSKGGDKDKEEKSFLSGLLRRLSIEPSVADEKTVAAVDASAPRVLAKTFPPSIVEVTERDTAIAVGDGPSSAKKNPTADKLFSTPDKGFDSLPTEARDAAEQRRLDAQTPVEDTTGGDDGDGQGGGDGDGSGGDSESLNLVLPEAVEVLMRALQRAQSPAVVSRCLLQLESVVAWLPAAPAPDEDRGATRRNGSGGGGGRKDFTSGRGSGGDEEGGRSVAGKAAAGGGSSSSTGKKGADGGDRERNADVLMSRQGWLVWCQRLVEALSTRNDNGDLMPRRGAGVSGYGYGLNDSMDMGGGGGDRWGTGGSEASEAGGYLDDSHSGVWCFCGLFRVHGTDLCVWIGDKSGLDVMVELVWALVWGASSMLQCCVELRLIVGKLFCA